jgi:hypothetical protein
MENDFKRFSELNQNKNQILDLIKQNDTKYVLSPSVQQKQMQNSSNLKFQLS